MAKGLPLTRTSSTGDGFDKSDNGDYNQLLLKCHTVSSLSTSSTTINSNIIPNDDDSFNIHLQTGILCRDELETGGDQWYAGLALANHLLHHPELVRNKVCIEVGAGLGLVGMIAAVLGAKRVVLTDLPCQLDVLHKNVSLNEHLWKKNNTDDNNNDDCIGHGGDDRCIVAAHSFGDVASITSLVELYGSFDVVLGSDVGYDVSLLEPLACSIHTLLLLSSSSSNATNANSSSVALLAEEVRWKDVYNWYKEALLCNALMNNNNSIVTASFNCKCDCCCGGSCNCDGGSECVCKQDVQQQQLQQLPQHVITLNMTETDIAFTNNTTTTALATSLPLLLTNSYDIITKRQNTCLISLYKQGNHNHHSMDDNDNDTEDNNNVMHLSSSPSPLRLLTLTQAVPLSPQSQFSL